jgi:hypothetical protein
MLAGCWGRYKLEQISEQLTILMKPGNVDNVMIKSSGKRWSFNGASM